ncbi:MAG: hypothetical protein LBV27_08245 [Oscillospiraceae bacterium]|jgi:hypothetical protein|nr:hypothetical protein [Oscillospiraceae bacterium]
MISIPTSNDIYIEVNGRKLAVAQSYRARTTRESQYVEAFGAAEPVATVGGKTRHLLELSRVCIEGFGAGDGVDFHSVSGFNVVIVKPSSRIIYSGCEWLSIDENASLGSVVLESVSIVAAKRLETA